MRIDICLTFYYLSHWTNLVLVYRNFESRLFTNSCAQNFTLVTEYYELEKGSLILTGTVFSKPLSEILGYIMLVMNFVIHHPHRPRRWTIFELKRSILTCIFQTCRQNGITMAKTASCPQTHYVAKIRNMPEYELAILFFQIDKRFRAN